MLFNQTKKISDLKKYKENKVTLYFLVLIVCKSSARRYLETITPYKLTSAGEKLRPTDNSKSMYLLTAELAKSRPPVFQDPPGDVRKMSKVWDAHYEGNLIESRGNNKANKIKTLLVNVHRGETKLNQFQTSEMTKSTIIQFIRNPSFDFDAGEVVEHKLESEDFTGVYSLLVKQISDTMLKTKEKKILSVLKRDATKLFADIEVPVRVLMNYARPIGKVKFVC